jgi:hypothetical protein
MPSINSIPLEILFMILAFERSHIVRFSLVSRQMYDDLTTLREEALLWKEHKKKFCKTFNELKLAIKLLCNSANFYKTCESEVDVRIRRVFYLNQGIRWVYVFFRQPTQITL